jgi:hypothetical protein
LADADLNVSPGGANCTFGQLFVTNGEVQYSYIASLEMLEKD